jgi:hypothetical protein
MVGEVQYRQQNGQLNFALANKWLDQLSTGRKMASGQMTSRVMPCEKDGQWIYAL